MTIAEAAQKAGVNPMTVIVDYGYGPHLPVPGTLRAPVTWRGGSMRQ